MIRRPPRSTHGVRHSFPTRRSSDLELANERNRLANERTFLAWMRTGLASVGGGVAVMRLLYFHNISHKILANLAGGILIVLGISIFCFAVFDYKKGFKRLKLEKEYNKTLYVIATIAMIFTIVTIILFLITVQDLL